MLKKLKFRSLSTRIWCMLMVLALTIILCISAIYGVVIRGIESNYNKDMLEEAHKFFMRDIAYTDIVMAEDIRSLARTQHLLVQLDEAEQLHIRPLGKKAVVPPEELTVVAQEAVEMIEASKIDESVRIVPYEQDGMLPKKEKIYLTMSNIEEQQDDAYVISYMKNEVKPVWQKEFMWIGIAFIIGSFIIAKIIARSIIKPLKELENHAFKIANKEWVEPLEVATEDEIGSLVHSINYMQTELQKKEKNQQQFLQSISHDLKTPIMVIEGHAQAIRDEMYVESLDYTAEIILKEAQRLEGKVGQMLYFNTLDYTLERTTKEQALPLDTLVKAIIEKFQVFAKELVWEVVLEPVTVYGNREQLEIAIENIIDNQLRYAKSCIGVRLMHEGETIRLEISNDGEPVKAEALDKLFCFQYKGHGGKFGLGLAITKKIICYYGGSISVENTDKGVQFVICLKQA